MADYINGKELFEELKIYHAEYKQSLSDGLDKPQVSNKIAEAIIQIATRLSNSFNFVGYTYKDEMIADGILKCLDKVHRFDPNISENSFAFFTQICWNAAINRIKIEQKQSSVKAKLVREKMSSDFVAHGVDADNTDGTNSFVEFLKENDAFIDYIEESAKKENAVNQNLKHRNKSGYATKKSVDVVESVNLFDLED